FQFVEAFFLIGLVALKACVWSVFLLVLTTVHLGEHHPFTRWTEINKLKILAGVFALSAGAIVLIHLANRRLTPNPRFSDAVWRVFWVWSAIGAIVLVALILSALKTAF